MCIQVTDDGLPYLAGLANLKSLNLYGCNQITDEGLAQHLSRLAKNCRIILI
jgi:hypothetical protein